jgi:phage terminase large subunit-like protein
MTYREFVGELGRSDDGAFAEYVAGHRFPAHLREVAQFATAHRRALVLLPRGHAKTTWATHHLARRIGASDGQLKIGIITATEPDALKRSRAVRLMVEGARFAEVFRWARHGVVSRKWTEAVWTVRGAERYAEKDATVTAGSLHGLRPGPRFDLLLADDLIGPDESRTQSQRQKASDRFWSVIEPMLTPTGRIIMLGTRWNESDLYAELTAKDWPAHVRPALSPNGTALWPSYWPAERLAAKRLEMGSALFDLQYQNDPSGMGGNVFRREWFRSVDALPPGCTRRLGFDQALTESERADYTAVVEWAEAPDRTLYLVGAWRARLADGHRAWLTGLTDAGELITAGLPYETGPRLSWPLDKLPLGFAGTTDRQPAPRTLTAVNIESVQAQVLFTRELLRTTRLPARAVYPGTDKVARARPLAARYEAGTVCHLRGAPGVAEFEAELVAFPNAEHDDLVDAAAYGADLGGSEFSFTSATW